MRYVVFAGGALSEVGKARFLDDSVANAGVHPLKTNILNLKKAPLVTVQKTSTFVEKTINFLKKNRFLLG